MRAHIPNLLTFFRIFLAVSGAVALYVSAWIGLAGEETLVGASGLFDRAALALAFYAVGAFFLAAITDWLDGYLARLWQVESALGALLDPIADKLLVDGYLLVYALILGLSGDTPVHVAVPVIVIVLRDVAITYMRLGGRGAHKASIPVSVMGKVKTTFAMIVTGFPLIAQPLGWLALDWVLGFWIAGLWATAALTLFTIAGYFRRKQD